MRIAFDTGAFIALERRQRTALEVLRIAADDGDELIAPASAVAEWWRAGRREKERSRILRAFKFEAPTTQVARLAGVAMGLVSANLGDALVMAGASIQGDVVYTADLDDFLRLSRVFPDVVVQRI
ncbi:MAG: PIN domain-containing protein [Labilithrix sp.]|nr:PIN domain-containing protein [Labilithrix sp.]